MLSVMLWESDLNMSVLQTALKVDDRAGACNTKLELLSLPLELEALTRPSLLVPLAGTFCPLGKEPTPAAQAHLASRPCDLVPPGNGPGCANTVIVPSPQEVSPLK